MKKSNFVKLICTSLVLVAFVGCGKDEKSSGAPAPEDASLVVPESKPASNPVVAQGPVQKGVSNPVTNPVVNNLNGPSQQAYDNALAWYNSTTENSVPPVHAKQVVLGVIEFSESNCRERSFIGGLINFNNCFGGGGNAPTFSDPVFVTVVNNTPKTGNAKLAKVFTAASGHVLVQATQLTGAFGYPVYTIEYGNNQTGHIIRYRIDTGLNSAFNPVEIYDSAEAKLEYVANPNSLR